MRPTVAGLPLVLAAALVVAGCGRPAPEAPVRAAASQETSMNADDTSPEDRVERTDEAWRARLTPEQYRVTRQSGTERAFTGAYWNTTTSGTYHCVCCGLALFESDAKFESGCGWPSFFEPLEGARLVETLDTSHGMVRTEITCRRCDAHLGHVFDDGPPPTGLRYCINSASLDLEPSSDD